MLRQLRTRYLYPLLLGLSLSCPASLFAADLNISDLPMAVNAAVEPNVMLLLDNSGSMQNNVWADGFDPTQTYEQWCGTCANNNRWSPTATFMTLRSINGGTPEGSCGKQNLSSVTIYDPVDKINRSVARYRVEGQIGAGTPKCLILPDFLKNGRSRYTGNYLNYLFQTYATGTDLTQVIPYKTRLLVMQQVTTELVNNTQGMRFGLTKFNGQEGGDVVAECGSGKATVTTKINGLSAYTSTPLAEAMYEITRYFRGMDKFYTAGQFTSPIQYRCQSNFVIAVTDGLPTHDSVFDSQDPDLAAGSLPDWDELNTTPRFSDGPGGSISNEGSTLYFDDIAKFAYDIDLRKSPAVDLTNTDFDTDPFKKQNIETYAVGFSIANQMLRDAGHYGSGLTAADAEASPPTNYFSANSHADLLNNLQTAITDIINKDGSASSAAASTGFVGTGTSLYQASFEKYKESGNWMGKLQIYELAYNPDTNLVTINKSDIEASKQLTALLKTGGPAARKIISYNPGIAGTNKGIEFTWASLSATQKTQLNSREEVLNYLRGDQACETSSAGTCPEGQSKTLRDRNTDGSGFLGTLVNSTPIYIAEPLERLPPIWAGADAPENVEGAENYLDFKTKHKDRKPLVYVGGNDGMLHAFNAETLAEEFAYVPNAVYSDLAEYTNPSFAHRYYVDGTPNVIDVFHGSNVGGDNTWRTILAGGLNKGGQGIYALDVTNPDSFSKNNVLWEFTDTDDRDLGYTFSRPAMVRMHSGNWVAVFGNGYNSGEIDNGDVDDNGVVDSNDDVDENDSTSGNAVLYIVDVHSGALIKKIDTGVGAADDPTGNNRSNGLSSVAPVDIDDDFIVDYIYAGDLFGNLWRFDVRSTNTVAWKVFGKGNNAKSPIFIAADKDGKRQPITARPEVTLTNTGALMVYFGTGMYLQLTDKTDTSQQSFYGLLDNPEDSQQGAPIVRGDMIGQTVVTEKGFSNELVRVFSANASSNQYLSWYIDFPLTENNTPVGERVIGPAIIRGISRNKKIIFTSIIPTTDACEAGGRSWLMELDARNGNQTTSSVFDLNFDGKLDALDNGNGGNEIYNGWSQTGIQATPAILTGKNIEFKILSGSTGKLRAVGEIPPKEKNGERQSWRQIK